ncbi:MAG: hypothetical protein M1423_06345 [Acidobacteria bacterium]|nr:hypothetical protein [Acidobacteriota bacterium]
MKRRTFLRGAAAAGALTMVNEWPKTASAADESVFKSRLNGMDLWIDRETGSIVYLRLSSRYKKRTGRAAPG